MLVGRQDGTKKMHGAMNRPSGWQDGKADQKQNVCHPGTPGEKGGRGCDNFVCGASIHEKCDD